MSVEGLATGRVASSDLVHVNVNVLTFFKKLAYILLFCTCAMTHILYTIENSLTRGPRKVFED